MVNRIRQYMQINVNIHYKVKTAAKLTKTSIYTRVPSVIPRLQAFPQVVEDGEVCFKDGTEVCSCWFVEGKGPHARCFEFRLDNSFPLEAGDQLAPSGSCVESRRGFSNPDNCNHQGTFYIRPSADQAKP